MKKAKWLTLVAVVLVTAAVVAAAAGCGSGNGSGNAAPSAAASLTPTQSFTKILGHAPTGMAASIATKDQFVVVDDANYPPQSYIDKNGGNLIGFDVDVAKRLSTILGIPAKIVNAPWASVLSGIPVGRFDVSIGSMTITTEREKSMAFSMPYYYTQAQVIVKTGSPILANAAALSGKAIGVGTGTTYAEYLDKLKGVKVKAYDTDASTFPDLKNGRLSGVMTADLTAFQAISSGYPFVFSGKPYYYEPLAFSTEKDQADWLALLNYAVNKMHQDGSLTTMAKKWYHGFDPTQAPHTGTPSFEQAKAAAP